MLKNCTEEKIVGIIIDNNEPIKGIKFRKKEKTANVGAKSL